MRSLVLPALVAALGLQSALAAGAAAAPEKANKPDKNVRACAEPYRIAGVVHDVSGRPVPNTQVILDGESAGLTDVHGNYQVVRASREKVLGLTLRFRASGFEIAESRPVTRDEVARKKCEPRVVVRDLVLSPLPLTIPVGGAIR